MNLSEHFTLQELTKTNTGLDNSPDEIALYNLRFLASFLEIIRESFGGKPVIINSAYRSEAVNKKVNGSATSAHRFGLAADFTIKGINNAEVYDEIRKSFLMYDQLILEPSWIHIGFSYNPRKQNLIYDGIKYELIG